MSDHDETDNKYQESDDGRQNKLLNLESLNLPIKNHLEKLDVKLIKK